MTPVSDVHGAAWLKAMRRSTTGVMTPRRSMTPRSAAGALAMAVGGS